MKALLLSNSTAPGLSYLEHALGAIDSTLGACRSLLFVPFALAQHEEYTAKVRLALEPLGVEVTGAHEGESNALVARAEAVFIGGGNTFRLVKELHSRDLIRVIGQRVSEGMPYLGSSAGTNVASPTLRTTNDMPIVEPLSFDTLGLIPFQINPHYLDADPASAHQGETREERILQFLEENDVPVLGMREGTWLQVDNGRHELGGSASGARLFLRGTAPTEVQIGTDLSWLASKPSRFDV